MSEKIYEINGEEYTKVDRPAKEGDLIVITSEEYAEGTIYDVGHVGRVTEVEGVREIKADFNGFNNSFVYKEGIWCVGEGTAGEYAVLERVHGRQATVMFVDTGGCYRWYKVGEVYDVEVSDKYPSTYLVRDGDDVKGIMRKNAIEIKDGVTLEKGVSDRDLIVRLSQTVAELSNRLDSVSDAVTKQVAEIERTADEVAMLTDDVVTLDERTQPLVDEGVSDFAKDLAELVEREINEKVRKGRI